MTDGVIVDPTVVRTPATSIGSVGHAVGALRLGKSFGELSAAFTGATDPMTSIASGGDQQVHTSIKNAAGNVQGWSEMISGFVGAMIDSDADNAAMLRSAIALPSYDAIDPDNKH